MVFLFSAVYSQTINVKDYIKEKFPSIFSFYLSSLEDLDSYEKEFIDLLEKLPEEEQEYYAKEVYKNGFSLELLEKLKKGETFEEPTLDWNKVKEEKSVVKTKEKPTEEVPEGMPTIKALLLQNAVTLDGEISGNEWDDAGQLSLTFTYSHGEPLLSCPGTIYLKHDGADLWICIRVQDDDENKFPEMSDYAAILFDANGDGDISHEDDTVTIHHGEGPEDLRPDEEGGTWGPDTEFGLYKLNHLS